MALDANSRASGAFGREILVAKRLPTDHHRKVSNRAFGANAGHMTDRARRFPWLNPGDRLVLLVVFGALIALLAWHYALRAGFGKPRPKVIPGAKLESHRVDINSAEEWELQALQGIGGKLAKAIVEHRRKIGRFKSVDELIDVSGIGPKTLDRLRPCLKAVAPGGKNEERR